MRCIISPQRADHFGPVIPYDQSSAALQREKVSVRWAASESSDPMRRALTYR